MRFLEKYQRGYDGHGAAATCGNWSRGCGSHVGEADSNSQVNEQGCTEAEPAAAVDEAEGHGFYPQRARGLNPVSSIN